MAETEPIEEIVKKTKTNIGLLVKALSKITYITGIEVTESHPWSKDFHKYKHVIRFKLSQPAHSDLENLMNTIYSRVTHNGLQADIHLLQEPYEKEHGEIDRMYEIVIESKEGITSPPKIREVTDQAIDKITEAVRHYIRKNPMCKQSRGDYNANSNN